MQAMQHLEGLMRKAMQSYNMVQKNDNICVGVSGGKDSVALALGLHHLSKYHETSFAVHALTLDPCFNEKETNYAPLEAFFKKQGIKHTVVRTNIGKVVFGIRQEKNPCALCAKLRRGILHTTAKKLGCNKVALGHHLDDAIETFFMNLFNEGRIGCFAPNTWLSRKELSLIRPMVFAQESKVVQAVNAEKLPIIKSLCPVDGITARASAKEFVAQRVLLDAAFKQKTLGAMQTANINGWAPLF